MESEGEELVTTVVLHIESPSIAAVCGLHHAVLLRVQVRAQTHFSFVFHQIYTNKLK